MKKIRHRPCSVNALFFKRSKPYNIDSNENLMNTLKRYKINISIGSLEKKGAKSLIKLLL